MPTTRQNILEEHSDGRQGHLLVVPAQGFKNAPKLGLLDLGIPSKEAKTIKHLMIEFEERESESTSSSLMGKN